MSRFLTGEDLQDTIYDIIWKAEEKLLIVSPYIKLDDYFKQLFDKHLNNPKLHLLIVFGKNENVVSRSLCKSDFEYFKKFPNISIIYVSNLHAKYYGNENEGVVTSINLYDHSFKNNIEFGIYSKQSVLSHLTDTFIENTDKDAWDKCIEIAETNDVIYVKRPVYTTKKFIVNLTKSYLESQTLLDYTEYFYGKGFERYHAKRLDEFPFEIEPDYENKHRPLRTEEKEISILNKDGSSKFGYCIRTGEKIKFNPAQPLSYSAWRTWNEFGNLDYPENFCHKTGQNSLGKTSVRNPIL